MKTLIIFCAIVGTFFAGAATNQILNLIIGDPSKVGLLPGILVTASVGCILIAIIGAILEARGPRS